MGVFINHRSGRELQDAAGSEGPGLCRLGFNQPRACCAHRAHCDPERGDSPPC